jgi:hypothetical protein
VQKFGNIVVQRYRAVVTKDVQFSPLIQSLDRFRHGMLGNNSCFHPTGFSRSWANTGRIPLGARRDAALQKNPWPVSPPEIENRSTHGFPRDLRRQLLGINQFTKSF